MNDDAIVNPEPESDAEVRRRRFRRIESFFLAAAALPERERPGWLDANIDDASIRDEVDALLAEDARPTSDALAIDRAADAAVGSAASAFGADEAAAPARIGRYRVIREVGRGGMGVVYEAEQDEPKRRVAIKLVATGLASPHLVDRFRREAHALGRLEHPGISRILEAGTHDAGGGTVPFFAMEYVEGRALTEALAGAPRRRALTVLADVADAVHHAHQRGVVHRDLKPANVLVDSDDRPRVVDFGVARLLEADDDAPGPATASGQLVGTPAYMSPEQTTGDPNAIDARSDIHALGALAYEVLAGRPPLEAEGRSLDEQLRRLREVPPRLLGSRDGVPRDVALVVAQALEKDPARRHASAAAFADDLRRARDGMTVSSRAPSTTYQLSRLAARHPVATSLLAVSVLMLVGGVAVIGTLLGRSLESEARAVRDATIARGVTDFLVDDFLTAANPLAQDSEVVTLDALIDTATIDVETRFAGEPDVAREVLGALTELDLVLGRPDAARNRLATIDALPAAAPPEPGDTDAIRRRERLMMVRAGVLAATDDFEAAHALYTDVREARAERLGPDDPATLTAAYEAARVLGSIDGPDAGEEALANVLATYERVYGPESTDTLEVVSEIASILHSFGRFERSKPYAERAAEAWPRIGGPDAWKTLRAWTNLATVHWGLEEYDAAFAAFAEARAGYERRGTPPTSSRRIGLDGDEGLARLDAGDLDGAAELMDRAMSNGVQAGLVGSKQFESLRHNLGGLRMMQGRHDEAERILAAVAEARGRALGIDDFETLLTIGIRGENLRRAGRYDEAATYMSQAWEGLSGLFGEADNYAVATARMLVSVHEELGDPEQAAIWAERAAATDDAMPESDANADTDTDTDTDDSAG